jgi:(R)-2-hydroxyacyl-CoA dehydratese activating ATPase
LAAIVKPVYASAGLILTSSRFGLCSLPGGDILPLNSVESAFMIFAGIDAGSRVIKAVLWEAGQQRLQASGTVPQGIEQEQLARDLMHRLLNENGIQDQDVQGIVATGYGRDLVRFAHDTITEITCHAAGVLQLAPEARTIIEIGGQDSKLIRLDTRGRVRDFSMNDRCAAGTGRFLEMVASRFNLDLSGLAQLAQRSRQPAVISSMCVVFAETEIIGLLARGVAPEDIAAGVQASLAARVAAMTGRAVDEPVYFTGGVALIAGMADALASVLQRPVRVVPDAMMTGALGAAILAARSAVG